MKIIQFSPRRSKRKIIAESFTPQTIGTSKNSIAPRDFYFFVAEDHKVEMTREEVERLVRVMSEFLNDHKD